jgi:hypothetical protein
MADDKLRATLKKLHRLLGSSNANERDAAWRKIDELLAKHKKSWNDLAGLIGGDDQPDDNASSNIDDGANAAPHPSPLDLINYMLEKYLYFKTEHQFVALTLWIAHTFVFNRFSVTPRLVLRSPVRGCGKTTGLNVINALALKTKKVDHITAAVTFRLIDRDRPTLLLDEVDNLDLRNNPTLRSVINSGHDTDGRIMRFLEGEIVEFSVFAPLALAFIGNGLPLPTLHRSIVINMERNPAAKLMRFDPKTNQEQRQDCDTVYRETFLWAQQCKLNPNPPLPEQLRNRVADNWRPLIAIADACGPFWAKAAREAAVALSKHQDEDSAVLLLSDIRDIFDGHPTTDRLTSKLIVDELNDLPDAPWVEWRGPRDDQTPRRLSQGQLARILAIFSIRPRTIWPPRRGTNDRSAKGYFRHQFEAAWASYCSGTPAQRNNIRYLNPR